MDAFAEHQKNEKVKSVRLSTEPDRFDFWVQLFIPKHPGPSISHYFCDVALVLIIVFARTGRGLKWFTFGFSPNIPTAPVR